MNQLLFKCGRIVCLSLFGVSFLWSVVTHVAVFFVPDGYVSEIAVEQSRRCFPNAPGEMLIVWQLVVGLGLFCGLFVLPINSPPWFAVLAGFFLGLWLNTWFLVVPYLGVYPNLPAAFLGMAMSGGKNVGLAYYGSVLSFNLLFWSLVGAIFLLATPFGSQLLLRIVGRAPKFPPCDGPSED